MNEIEVKACPFCGGKGHISRDHCPDDTGIFYSTKCGSCGAKSGEKYASHGNDCGLLYQEVRDLWNNRPLESAKDARIAELEAENKRLHEALEPSGSTKCARRVLKEQPDNKRLEWPDGNVSIRVGKKKSGNLLDGKEHQAFPDGEGV
jgi:hypothetical protein